MNIINSYKNMSQPVKASFWFMVCNTVNKGLALFATPILTRIMSTEQYGTFSVFQSWIAIFTIFCTLNIFQSAYSRGIISFEGQRDRFCSALLGLSTTLTIIIACICLLSLDFWASAMSMSPFLVIMVFVEILLMSAYEFWAATQRFDYKYRALVIVSIGLNAFSLIAGIIGILNTEYKVEARVIADVVAKGIPGLILGILILDRGRCFFNVKYWKYALAFNIPLLPHFLSFYVLNQSDRLMISNMLGNDATALYSVAHSIAMMMIIITTAINSSYSPYTFKELAVSRTIGIRKSSLLLLMMVFGLCVMVMAFAPEVLAIFAGPEYASAVTIIPPLAASVFYIFLYNLFSNIEYFYKKTAIISIASISCAILNIVLNCIAIPRWGYGAAAWATLISYMTLCVFHWVFYSYVCKKEGISHTGIYSLRVFAALSVALPFVTLCMVPLCDYPIARYLIIAVIAIAMFVKRKEIIGVIRRNG